MLGKLSAKLNRLFPDASYPRGINTDRKVERAQRRYKRDTYPAENYDSGWSAGEGRKRRDGRRGRKRGKVKDGGGTKRLVRPGTMESQCGASVRKLNKPI